MAKVLQAYGYAARRGAQTKGGQLEADVVAIPGWHIEAKRVERLNIYKAFEQAEKDSKKLKDGKPCVIHRKNYGEWMVTLRLADWIKRED